LQTIETTLEKHAGSINKEIGDKIEVNISPLVGKYNHFQKDILEKFWTPRIQADVFSQGIVGAMKALAGTAVSDEFILSQQYLDIFMKDGKLF